MALTSLLIIAATALSFVAVLQSQGKSVLAWACFCLSLAACWPLLR